MKKLFILLTIFILGTATFAEEMSKSKQAIALYNDNNIREAMKVLQSIPEDDKTAEDWLLMGNILQDNNKIPDAIFMYKRAILVDKDFYKPYYNLGNIYLYDEKPLLAIENYKNSVKIKSDFPYGYYNIGCAYLRLGNYKLAKKYLLKAVDLKNTEPDFQYNLAFCYKQLNKNKLAQRHLDYYNKLMETY